VESKQQRFRDLLDKCQIHIEQSIRSVLGKIEGSVIEPADIRQEISCRLWERFDYIETEAQYPIACAKRIIEQRANRCLAWLYPGVPPGPEAREDDKQTYANDWEQNLDGPAAAAWSRHLETGEQFDGSDI